MVRISCQIHANRRIRVHDGRMLRVRKGISLQADLALHLAAEAEARFLYVIMLVFALQSQHEH